MSPVALTLWLMSVATALLLLFLFQARRRQRALLATIEVAVLPSLVSTHLNNERDIFVFLPPEYHQTQRRYPVLYINDGQDRGILCLHETMAWMLAKGTVWPFIAVAIPTNDNRLQEYGTAVTPNAQGLGRLAAAYACFVVEELLPLINDRFRTLETAEHTAVLGASLGGLSAFDIAWNHRERFGIVGVFSGSFWWRAPDKNDYGLQTSDWGLPIADCGSGDKAVVDSAIHNSVVLNVQSAMDCPRPGRLIAQEMVRCGDYLPGFRAWFQTGTRDEVSDRDDNGVIDAIQDTLELIEALEEKGYRRGRDLAYVEVLGGRHDYETWSKVLPDFLQWAFGRAKDKG